MNYYNRKKNITNQQGFPQILMTDLQQLPIKIGSNSLMLTIESIVDNILRSVHDIQDEIQKLNSIVYQLYGLSEDEVKVVEGE